MISISCKFLLEVVDVDDSANPAVRRELKNSCNFICRNVELEVFGLSVTLQLG